MKISLKKIYILILFAGILAHFYLVNIIQGKVSQDYHEKMQTQTSKDLERMHASFSFTKIFSKKFSRFFKKIEGKTVKDMKKEFRLFVAETGIPAEAFTLIAYNGYEPLNVPESEIDNWRFVMQHFDNGEYPIKRVEGDDKNRMLKILKAGIGFENNLCRPGMHSRLGHNQLNSYCVWYKTKKITSEDEITALIIISHEKYINKQALARAFFKEAKLNKNVYGYIHSVPPKEYFLPTNISGEKIDHILSLSDIKSGFKKIHMGSKEILASYKPNGNIFIAILDQNEAAVPFWANALILMWLPWWYTLYTRAKGEFKLTLNFLTSVMFILVVLIPGTAIAIYWKDLIASKREAIKLEKISNLQNNLIQLDANGSTILRVYKKTYEDMFEIVKKDPYNIQALIDRSIELELQGFYDTCMILDSEGNHIRKNATASSMHRLLALYPDFYREALWKQFFHNGWIPFDTEVDFVKKYSREKFDINAFLDLNPPQGVKAMHAVTRVLAKDIIDLYNSKHGKAVHQSGKHQISAAVMASISGGKADSYVGTMYNNMGNFFDFGYGKEISRNYVSVICNEDGTAEYCTILFSCLYNFSNKYLHDIFTHKENWPDNVNYMALTNRKLHVNYPYLDLWRRLSRIYNIVKPPITLYSEEVNINNIPHLLCAYSARNTENFILIATMPISVIDKETGKFQNRMAVVALLYLAITGFIMIRAYNTAVSPTLQLTAGVKAMKNHNDSYKIHIETGDEWEQLGNTFNTSLESMKEMEVATFIQDTILPSGTVKSGLIEFEGTTVSVDGIGGDYFDAFPLDENEMLFLFGDVSGHSVSAALVVSMAHAGFASLFDSGVTVPSEILKQFSNLMLTHLKRVKMMTCFSGFINKEGLLTCSNAGQTFPLIVDEEGNITKAAVVGYPLGSAKRAKFRSAEFQLPSRCRIVLYSDGIIEAMNKSRQPFGYERFEKLIKGLACKGTLKEFRAQVYKALHAFTDPVPWDDDCSIAVVDYTRPEPPEVKPEEEDTAQSENEQTPPEKETSVNPSSPAA